MSSEGNPKVDLARIMQEALDSFREDARKDARAESLFHATRRYLELKYGQLPRQAYGWLARADLSTVDDFLARSVWAPTIERVFDNSYPDTPPEEFRSNRSVEDLRMLGSAEGRAEGRRLAVARLLWHKLKVPPATIDARLRLLDDAALDALIPRILTATSVEQVLGT